MNEPAPTFPSGGKRSPLFWTCGGCAFIGVAWMVGLVIGVVIVAVRSHSQSPTHEPMQAQTAEPKPPPDDPETAPWTEFHNTKSALAPGLQEQFVAFTFRYPADHFKLTPSAVNFVTMQRVNAQDPKAFVPMESLFIAPVSVTRADATGVPREVAYSDRLKEAVKMIADQFQQYRSLGEKEDTVDGVKARTITFGAILMRQDQTKAPILGKIIVVHEPQAKTGLVMILSVDASSGELTCADEVGVKGELGKVMKTFRFEH